MVGGGNGLEWENHEDRLDIENEKVESSLFSGAVIAYVENTRIFQNSWENLVRWLDEHLENDNQHSNGASLRSLGYCDKYALICSLKGR